MFEVEVYSRRAYEPHTHEVLRTWVDGAFFCLKLDNGDVIRYHERDVKKVIEYR